ncbi:hypothetical protein ACS0TY_035501 [Phlomoides rotata]
MGSLRVSIEEKFGPVPYFFIYVIVEWVVIILLFIDGFLAFLSNEIARIFELKIPCLLCTRLDHVLIHRDSNFYYNDSICEVHKKDISALTYCHAHKKISDIRTMCQGCLLSFTMDKDSDCDRCKSVAGNLHKDIDCLVEDERRLLLKPLKKDDMEITHDENISVLRCSCCGDPLKPKSCSKLSRSLSMNAPASSPRAPWFPGRNEEGGHFDFPHTRYTELKLSDNESELLHEDNHEDVKATGVPLVSDTEHLNDESSGTPIYKKGNKFFGISLTDSPRWGSRSSRNLPSDKLDLVMESIDGSEGEGDIIARLKRQVQLERRSMMALYMELDEERSASAIAANNAMAMITRLQAEKAAVQMEASQYQRMMEEQAEYDQEALQMTRDMFFKREDEIKELESELEMYREKYGHMKQMRSEICEVDVDDDYQDMNFLSENSSQNENECGYEGDVDFEGERCYLLGMLSDLEKKVNRALDQESDDGNEGVVTREVSLIRERLRAVEAESGFLKHASMALQRGGEGVKLLNEIAYHLRKLRLNESS